MHWGGLEEVMGVGGGLGVVFGGRSLEGSVGEVGRGDGSGAGDPQELLESKSGPIWPRGNPNHGAQCGERGGLMWGCAIGHSMGLCHRAILWGCAIGRAMGPCHVPIDVLWGVGFIPTRGARGRAIIIGPGGGSVTAVLAVSP